MAIQGTFQADFSSFFDAVQKAEASLRSFDGGAGKVESSLNRMVDSFSGRKIITGATLMAEAVERIGGTSKLTEAELARLGRSANEAADKMRAMGIDVPPSLQKLAASTQQIAPGLAKLTDTAGGATNAFGTFHTGLAQADRTLAAFGVNLGPQVQALNELSAASGKTATQLGLIGTAGLAAAAGFAGWQTGRLIADLFDLDEKIGNVTAKLMGFGDVAGETAAYKADVLARASEAAGRQITSMADATKILTDASKAHQDSLFSSESLMERYRASLAKAGSDASKLTGAQRALILEGTKYGDSVGEISKALHLNERAVQAVVDAEQKHLEAMKQAAAELEKYAKAQEQADTEYRKFRNQIGEQEIADHAAMLKQQETLDADYRKFQNDIGVRMMEDDAARMKAEEAAHAAHLQVLLGQDAAYLAQTAALAASIAASGTGVWTSDMAVPKGSNVWTSDMGVPTGGNIWSSPSPIYAGATSVPSGGGNTTINMSGLLLTNDPSARESLRKAVDDALVSGAKRSRKFSF